MTDRVNQYLAELSPYVELWALSTQSERELQRRGSNGPQMQAFYDAITPRMEGIIDALNDLSLGDLPDNARTLMNLTLSLAEIAPHVEFYQGAPGVPFAFAEERFIAERADWTQL
ncbi:MAG: hypothetical protein JKY89_12970 [Immundisolibacteraceae bacterium]|nr:hypothetical protein [Immundisolibacteraceae bacterium]